MKWTLKDKITIAGILPEKGSMFNMALVRDIKKKLEITPEEIKQGSLIRLEKGGVTWKKNIEIKLDLTKDELTLLKESANKAKQEEEVTEGNLELIEKLIK